MDKTILKLGNIKLRPNHDDNDLINAIAKALKLDKKDFEYAISKKSIDSRHKPDIFYVYSVDIFSIRGKSDEKSLEAFYKKASKFCKNLSLTKKTIYEFPFKNTKETQDRPVVIGFGPAGIFCALELAKAGLKPIVFERGLDVDTRTMKVSEFWENNKLDESCNVQFGEGGAGTFSDGKLNTQINDTYGRISYVLNTFVEFGAKNDILYVNKPHIGTDVLSKVIKNIRNYIIQLGGEINFNCCLQDLCFSDGKITGVIIKNDNEIKQINCKNVCLAIGHSARDTFEMLYERNINMEPKPFAVGVRIEHPQAFINNNSYGDYDYDKLPAADYKVTYKSLASGKERGVYSFCMCPGGYVVNASSEKNMLCVNGMSYSGRDSHNANSAIIVTVGPEDFGDGVLDGMKFQRDLEKKAYNEGKSNVPIQLFKDFENNTTSDAFGEYETCLKGNYTWANLRNILPEYVSASLIDGIHGFSRYIKNFNRDDAILLGVESRTSSPIRINRNDYLECMNLSGLYPCGEGAGYAGGITSASVDGVKVAESIAKAIINP